MPLQLQQSDEIQSSLVASWAASNNVVPALPKGSAVLAIFQAFMYGILWLQALCKAVYSYARASTCAGADLDSWMAQFPIQARMGAIAATGLVRMSIAVSSGSPTNIALNTIVQTTDGSGIQYKVIANTLLSAWNPTAGLYQIPAGQLHADVQVQALLSGSGSNVQAGALTAFGSSVLVNSVTNLSPIINGAPPETDNNFRARFVVFINSLSRATRMAILNAVVNVQQDLQVVLLENLNPLLQFDRGNFLVVVNPASGFADSDLLAAVYSAVDAVRGFTINFGVIAPLPQTATVSISLHLVPGAITSKVLIAAKNAILDYIDSLGIGETLYAAQIVTAAMEADPVNILSADIVNGPLLNGLRQDIATSAIGIIRSAAGDITVAQH